jgi:Rieske Fe-S protein
MESQNSRRDFLKKVITFSCCSLGTITLANLLNSCENIAEYLPETGKVRTYEIDISLFPELSEIGSCISRAFGNILAGKDLIIVRKDIGTVDDFIVFSSICPHGGAKILLPYTKEGNFHCFEHYSEYDFYTGDMKVPPNNEENFYGRLFKFKCEFNPSKNILTIFY